MRRCELRAVAIFTVLWTCGGWALAQALAAEELRFGDALREEQFGIGVELPSLTVQSGEYDVDLETAKANLLAQHLVVSGALRLKGGTFRMGKKPVLVFGDFFLGSGATFVPGNAPLILDGDPTILRVEQKAKTITIPAQYGPVYGPRGTVLVATGVLVTATGSRTEWYTPTLGDVHIGASPGTTFLSSDTTFSFLQVGTGDTLVSSGYALTVNGSSTGGTLIYGELRLNGRAGATTQTLLTQRHNYFRTSGNGKVTTVSGTGTILLIGSGADAAAPFSLTVSGSLQNLTLDNGLVGYWKLDDGAGTSAKDASRFKRQGTLTNMEQNDWTTTGLNTRMQFYNPSALDFDGSNEYVQVTSYGAIENFNRFSVSVWVKTDVADSQHREVIRKGTSSAWFLLQNSNNKWAFSAKGNATEYNDTTTSLTTGVWTHLVGVYDGTRTLLYKDGTLSQNVTVAGSVGNSTAPVCIAAICSGLQFFNGLIDDVRIYNRALSDSEITSLYNGNKSTGSGVYTLGSALDVNGNLAVHAGTIDPTASNYGITVGGNAQIHGDITKRSNTFTMDGTNQTLSGSTVFHNFSKTVTAADTLYLDHTARQSFSGALTLRGTAGNTLSLRSTRTGSASSLLLDGDSGTQTIDFLDVQDNDAVGGAVLECFTTTEGCANSGNNNNWAFAPTVSITGTVYTDEGSTVIGGSKTLALSINGAAVIATDDTDAGGQFTLADVPTATGDVLTLYLEDETEDAVMVAIASGSTMTGVHLYQDRLIVRNLTGGTVSTTHLATADNVNDGDIHALYRMDGSILQVSADKELFVWPGSTLRADGRIKTHDLEVQGTLTLSTHGLTVSGSLVANLGTLTTSTGVLLTSTATSESLSLGSNSLQNLTLDNGLVGYWKFDDGVGTVARDSSRYGNNGTLTNEPTWSGSTVNGAARTLFYNPHGLRFDGTNDYVNVTRSSSLNLTRQLTVLAWVNARSAPSGASAISEAYAGDGVVQYALGFGINEGPGGSSKLKFGFYNGTWRLAGEPSNIETNQWIHIAGTWDGTTLKVYKNGAETATNSPGSSITAGTEAFYIGRRHDAAGSVNFFPGAIDDVRIYNRALSPGEIQQLYNGSKSTGSGVYVLGSALDVNGNLAVHAGTIDPTASNYGITVGGNAQIHGDITKRSNTFTMDGTNQTLSGSTVFHNFTKTVTAADTLYLDHTARQSFSGALTVRGAAGNLLSLRSTRVGSGTNFLLDADTGTQTIDYLDVQDNDASGGAELVCTGCTDSGRNTNWSFVAAAEAVKKMKHWFFFLE